MKIVCAWCGVYIGEKDGQGIEGVSHGVCPECLKRLQEKSDEQNGLCVFPPKSPPEKRVLI
jgi:hypothetical protein